MQAIPYIRCRLELIFDGEDLFGGDRLDTVQFPGATSPRNLSNEVPVGRLGRRGYVYDAPGSFNRFVEKWDPPPVDFQPYYAASAIVDRSHATVVRCISRTSFGSNGRARCIVARLSHITRSHCFHAWA